MNLKEFLKVTKEKKENCEKEIMTELKKQVLDKYKTGSKIKAIKFYRGIIESSLREAKRFVEDVIYTAHLETQVQKRHKEQNKNR